jgi:hypothetical protein
MKPEIKQKWCEALRSGDYTQTDCYLRDRDGFCCLGVLCELHRREVRGEWVNGEDCASYFDAETSLPKTVIDWAGLTSSNPEIAALSDEDDEAETLANLNDEGNTFPQIADVIEKYL